MSSEFAKLYDSLPRNVKNDIRFIVQTLAEANKISKQGEKKE